MRLSPTSRVRRTVSLLLCLLGAATAFAQSFDSATVIPIAGTAYAVASGDFNKDGSNDVVYQDAHTGGNLHILLNNGKASFQDVQQIPLPLDIGERITVADVNGDGYPDLLVGYDGFDSNFTQAEIGVLLNQKNGTFGPPIFSSFSITSGPATVTGHLAVADFNGDGHTDFAFDSLNTGVCLMRGDGAGHFTPTVLGPDSGSDAFVGDFNEDGKPDIVVRSLFQVSVLLNKGGGSFGPLTAATGFLYQAPWLWIADLNNDGHLDVLYSGDSGFGGLSVAYGKGDGTFTQDAFAGTSYAPILGVADTNGDGRPDVISTTGSGAIIGLQNANGKFSNPFEIGPAIGDFPPNYWGAYADFDRDGLGDLITPATGGLVLSKGLPNGTFTGSRTFVSLEGGSILDVQVADLDRDGNPDVVASQSNSGYYSFLVSFLGDGTGNFTYIGYAAGLAGQAAGQSVLADFNHDGYPDVFNGGYALWNNGHGNFTSASLIAPTPTAGSIPGNARPLGYTVTGDFNEDGFPDAVDVVTTPTANLVVAISSGPGQYTSYNIALPGGSGPIVTGDFNHDGHLDLAVAGAVSTLNFTETAQITILFGDGRGNFSIAQTYSIPTLPVSDITTRGVVTDLEAADIDKDGNLDLIVPIAGHNQLLFYYGRVDGTFASPVTMATAQDVRFVTVADMDLDGIPDLILSGHSLVRILHGLGNRTFGPAELLAANEYPQKPRVADVNRDGYPDILVPNGGYSPVTEPGDNFTVILNTTVAVLSNQLVPSASCTPEPSPAGSTFQCTATFKPISNPAVPSGLITWTIDGGSPTSAALTNGASTLTFSPVNPGPHLIVASFPGDSNFASAKASVTHTVSPDPTTTTLTCSPDVIYISQSTNLFATVTSGGGIPTGAINFTDNGATISQVVLTAGATASVNGYMATSPGAHTISAAYVPTGGFASSTASCSLTVSLDPDSITLSSSQNPSTSGQPVTLTAAITYGPPLVNFAGYGTVTFIDGVMTLGTATVNPTTTGFGSASLTTSLRTSGPHSIVAVLMPPSIPYPVYATNTAFLTQNVNPIGTSSVLTVIPASPNSAQTLTLTATVVPMNLAAGNPGGTVAFTIDGVAAGSAPVAANQTATETHPPLLPGSHSITCAYSGDANYAPSACGPYTLVISQATSNTSLTSSLNPAYLTQPVTFTATVSGTPGTPLAGAVTFYDSNSALGTATLGSNGAATFNTSTLSAGTHSITAIFTDTLSGILSSTSAPLQQIILPSTFALTLSPASLTQKTGQPGSTQLQLTSIGNFSGPLTLGYGALPPYTTATFSTPTVSLTAGGQATATLSLTTFSLATNRPPAFPWTRTISLASALLLLPLVRRRRLARLVFVALALLSTQALTGCVNSWYQAHVLSPGTYTIPVTATDQNHNTQTATLTLTVTP